ncbi:MAG: hypothetical protein KGL39_56730 [Patescibacteria group bacterium]|nr:hypothetical protein [Patescibacteria group bacterium]
MKQSLPGLLLNAGRAAEKGDRIHGAGYYHSLENLLSNLRQLRERTKAGDMTVIDEFFEYYVFDDETERT